MLAIIGKELRKNLLVTIAFIVLTMVITLVFNDYLPGLLDEERETLGTSYSLMLGIFVNMIIFGGFISNEKEEDQSEGYAFLGGLPIDSFQIVAGKFVAAVCYALFAVVLVGVSVQIFGVKLESKLLPVAYTLFSSGIALVLVGILYLFVFRIRYSKLLAVVMVVYVLAIIAPQGSHLLMLILGKETTVEQIFSELTMLTGGLVFLGSLLVFTVLGYFAIGIKKKNPLPQ